MNQLSRKVFLLQHAHSFDDGEEDVKIIGVYSSMNAAMTAIERARTLDGFRQVLDGFSVDEYTLDEDEWREGYRTVIAP